MPRAQEITPDRESRPNEVSRDPGVDVQKTSNDTAELEAAIARITRRLATAPDEEIADLVSARADLRNELRQLREREAGNVVVFPRR